MRTLPPSTTNSSRMTSSKNPTACFRLFNTLPQLPRTEKANAAKQKRIAVRNVRISHCRIRMPSSYPQTETNRHNELEKTTPAAEVDPGELRSPTELRKTIDRLGWMRDRIERDCKQANQELVDLEEYLAISDQVTEALDTLSQKLFEEVLGVLEEKLSIALEEVLEQPIRFKADASFKRGTANVDFSIQRSGNTEDVNRGQGGSVQNVLSVGLRLFALARLDAEQHRRFLVLDEQDCWLRPELVPRLVNIVHRAAKELKFQVILISHHDVGLFEEFADKIYRFTPTKRGAVGVEQVLCSPHVLDSGDMGKLTDPKSEKTGR